MFAALLSIPATLLLWGALQYFKSRSLSGTPLLLNLLRCQLLLAALTFGWVYLTEPDYHEPSISCFRPLRGRQLILGGMVLIADPRCLFSPPRRLSPLPEAASYYRGGTPLFTVNVTSEASCLV